MFTSQSQQSRFSVPSTFSKYLLSIEMQESLKFDWCYLTSLTACTSFGAKTIFRAQLATTCKRNLKARKSSKIVVNNKKRKVFELIKIYLKSPSKRPSRPNLNSVCMIWGEKLFQKCFLCLFCLFTNIPFHKVGVARVDPGGFLLGEHVDHLQEPLLCIFLM